MGGLGTLKHALLPLAALVGQRTSPIFQTYQNDQRRRNNVAAETELASHPSISPLIYPGWRRGKTTYQS